MSLLRFVIIAAVLSFEILGDVSNLKQSQESGMFAPIGHPDHKNVVELVHPVDLGQQLVDDGVVHLRSKLDNYKRRMKPSFTPELSPPLDPRALQIASISSKMMMCRPVLMRKMMMLLMKIFAIVLADKSRMPLLCSNLDNIIKEQRKQ